MWKQAGSTEADANAALVPVSAALAEFHANPLVPINSRATMTFVKVNAIGTNGLYQGSGTVEATFAPIPGAATVVNGSSFPNQVALAVTCETGFTRGPAHSGRFFLPMPVVDLDANGVMLAIRAEQIGQACDTLRAAVNTTGQVMTVMSRKQGAPGHRAITGFTVGRVLDTQRRRRRSLAEDYQ